MPGFDFDREAFFAVYGGANGTWGSFMIALTLFGGGWSALALAPMIGNARTSRFAASLALALAVQAVLVWVLKRVVGRVRPWIALGLPQPIGAPHDPSFPSGHAAGSFCVAAFLALALPAIRPASPCLRGIAVGLAAVLAALVATSRVYLGAHFPSDVAVGALLGALVGANGARLYAAHGRPEPPIR